MRDYIKKIQEKPMLFMIVAVVLMVFMCGNNSNATSVSANLTADQASAHSSGMSHPIYFQGGVLACTNSGKLCIQKKELDKYEWNYIRI